MILGSRTKLQMVISKCMCIYLMIFPGMHSYVFPTFSAMDFKRYLVLGNIWQYRTEEKLGSKKLWRIIKNSAKFFCQPSRLSRQHDSTLHNSPNFLSAKILIVGFTKVFYRQVFLPYGNTELFMCTWQS